MSIQTKQRTVECKFPDCDTVDPIWKFHHGKYCSTECELRHDGQKALAPWKYSHTRCFTCLNRLKEIEPPKPDSQFVETGTGWAWDEEFGCFTLERYDQEVTRTCAVGYQHLTPEAGVGEKDVGPKVATGAVCDVCGNTDHTAHHSFLVDTHPTAGRIADYLQEESDRTFCIQTLHRAYAETDDLELAVGKAIDDV